MSDSKLSEMTNDQLRERIVDMTKELARARYQRHEAFDCLKQYFDEICDWPSDLERPMAHYRAAGIIARSVSQLNQ